MKFLVLLLGCVAPLAFGEATSSNPTNELLMAQAEAQAYREAWSQLQRRDQLLGLASLSGDARDSHDKVVRLSGELIRAEKALQSLRTQAKILIERASTWAGETSPVKKAAARSEFESAKRSWDSKMAEGSTPRALASGLTEAQIVAVDSSHQSLVLNLGRLQGAREGMPFRILRGDQVIGNCRLLEVRELISAGMTEKLTDGIQPKVGDRVSVLAQK